MLYMDLVTILHLLIGFIGVFLACGLWLAKEKDHEGIQKETDTDQRLPDFHTARFSEV